MADPLVYADLEMSGPGTTANLTVTVPAGEYWWRCTFLGGGQTEGARFEVHGRGGRSAHPFVPASSSAILGAVIDYQSHVSAGLATLQVDTDALVRAAGTSSPTAIESAWLTAHLDYERLGAAYGTFGDLDTAINGTPFGLAGGVDDPHWTGFRRVEHDLWDGSPAAVITTDASVLDAAVHQLVGAFPTETIPPADLALRVHEILENTLQFELTGETDEGSHTNLATASANVDGTDMALAAVAPLLQTRSAPLLRTARRDLASLHALLAAYRKPDGTWVPLADLTAGQRQQLDGRFGATVEDLAPVPDLLELTIDSSRD